ncbi:helix-turn-helix domain-containing protein [Ralstonia insidiosa]|uniref:Helix-turn-helix domain-containing protein n=1 Tax=Ralstonia insidiosa TaxID=190721 RepID=A0A848NNI9_9RALS|nr:RodZ family helix-turn-helix domain-containing protein [Ralstonia insidiosa]NMV36702.1 helix-turn-helix domain-containing protein [Ralstonia insidiosa]
MTDRDVASAADVSQGAAPASGSPAAVSPERDDALREIAERLRAGREHQRLTVEDLATRLKVAPGKLLAVEAADVSALPDMTFAKGLIRAYARVLQVDVDDQLVRLNARAPVANIGLRPEGGLGESFSDKPSFSKRRGGGWLIGLVVAVVVAGGALAGMDRLKQWFAAQTAATQTAEPAAKEIAPTEQQPAPAEAAQAPAPAQTETPAASLPTPLTPVAPAAPASGVVTAPLTPPPTLPRSDNGNGAAPAPVADAVSAKPAVVNVDAPAAIAPNEAAKPAESATGNSAVSVRFSGASWFEIKDKSGKTLASGLAKEGDARDLTGTPPFKVTFGNAEAVESLTVGGASVDIQKYARNRVARATLP